MPLYKVRERNVIDWILYLRNRQIFTTKQKIESVSVEHKRLIVIALIYRQ